MIATLGYWLVGLHAAAALVHHSLVHHSLTRDDTPLRMLPARSARVPTSMRNIP
jgi:cytochrome b561